MVGNGPQLLLLSSGDAKSRRLIVPAWWARFHALLDPNAKWVKMKNKQFGYSFGISVIFSSFSSFKLLCQKMENKWKGSSNCVWRHRPVWFPGNILRQALLSSGWEKKDVWEGSYWSGGVSVLFSRKLLLGSATQKLLLLSNFWSLQCFANGRTTNRRKHDNPNNLKQKICKFCAEKQVLIWTTP